MQKAIQVGLPHSLQFFLGDILKMSRPFNAISMEVATAAADLTGGADAVVLRHPESVATIKKFITELV